MPGWLYILKLNNGKYYIGSTKNLEQRIFDHSHGKSPYTRKFLPTILKFSLKFDNFSQAIKAERHLKKLKSKIIIEKIINSQTFTFT